MHIFHKWLYLSKSNRDRVHSLRMCTTCGKVQGLDVDGWCNPLFLEDADKMRREFAYNV